MTYAPIEKCFFPWQTLIVFTYICRSSSTSSFWECSCLIWPHLTVYCCRRPAQKVGSTFRLIVLVQGFLLTQTMQCAQFVSILPILYAAEFFSLVQCLYCEFLHACYLPKTALPYDFELQIWPLFKSMCSMILYVMISHWMYEEHNSFFPSWHSHSLYGYDCIIWTSHKTLLCKHCQHHSQH